MLRNLLTETSRNYSWKDKMKKLQRYIYIYINHFVIPILAKKVEKKEK